MVYENIEQVLNKKFTLSTSFHPHTSKAIYTIIRNNNGSCKICWGSNNEHNTLCYNNSDILRAINDGAWVLVKTDDIEDD